MNPRAIFSARYSKNRGPHSSAALSVVVFLAILLSLFFWVFSRAPQGEIPQSVLTVSECSFPCFFWSNIDFSSPTDASSSRPVYPYSVIPRGAENGHELQAAIRSDPVVSAHYSDFRVQAARPIRLSRQREFFVSYRLGNQVYWTRRKITIHAGETLLTDGTHLARTRCGNRFSEVPATPTLPSEPTDRAFNTPVVPLLPELTSDTLPGAPIWPGSATPVLLLASSPAPQPAPSGPSGFIPPLCCVTSSGPSPNPNSPTHPAPPPSPSPSPSPLPQPPPYFPTEPPSPPPPTVPPIATPEPGTLTLAAAGLILLLIVRRLRRD